MAAAALPVGMGLSSLFGGIFGKKSAKKTEQIASTPTAGEKQASAGAFGSAGKLGGMGKTLYGQGTGALGRTSSYLETMMGKGGRGAMESATAPAKESIEDLYGGVSRSLQGANVRGGTRDLAIAEADREKYGKIARLTAGVQPAAAAALTDIGKFQTSSGVGATAGAGGIYSDLLGKELKSRELGLAGRLHAEEARGKTGGDIGSMLFQLLASGAGKGGGKSATSSVPGVIGQGPSSVGG